MRAGTFGLRLLLTSVVLFAASSAGEAQIASPLRGGVAVVVQEDNVEQAYNLSNEGDAPFRYSFAIQSGGPRDGRDGIGPQRDAGGGPDDFEYVWRDTDEEDGPVFEWIDISEREGVVDIQNLADDGFYGMYDLGFAFPYYGEEYNEIGIDANGFVCFDEVARNIVFYWPQWGDLPNANPGAQDQTPPPTLIAGNFQDLLPSRDEEGNQIGHIYYWSDETMAVASWVDMPHIVDVNQAHWTFQIILTADGLIKFQYAAVGAYDAPGDVLIGIQNEARDRGFTVSRDDREYIQAEKAVAFGPPSAWINWVTVEPQSGELQPAADEDIILTFIPGDHEDGYYWANILFNVEGQARQITPVAMSINSPVGSIEGVITDAATDRPVSGALVELDDVGMWQITDDNGAYLFENLPPRTYQLSVSAENFNDYPFGDIEVAADEAADGSIALLHGEFTPSLNEIARQLAPDTDVEVDFTVANGGNAPVHFTTDRRLLGDANAAPWEVRRTLDVGMTLEDDRIEGAVYVDGSYYLSGAAGADPNQVYVLNEDGEETARFNQAGHSRYGYKDLEWDGEWIWGSGEDSIYAFTPDGEVQLRFRAPHNPDNCLAWDSDNEVMWVSGTTTNLVAVDRDGNVVGEPLNRRSLRIYGLGYFPEDPDGFNLYMLTQPVEGPMTLYKMNAANGDTALVHAFDFGDGAAPGGIFLTNELDVYSWVMLMMTNVANADGGDRLKIIQVAARRDWMQILPTEGVIEPDNSLDFTVTLDATGLPETTFEGEIVFMHDARGSETRIGLTLDVVLGPVHAIRQYPLALGWNTVSANIQPDDGEISVIMGGLAQQGLVAMMKDGFGHFYVPSENFNNVPPWDVAQGYQIKMLQPAALPIEGTTVMADDPIALHQGWQIAPYYPRIQVDATVGFGGIVEHLQVAKAGDGGFYLPAYDFNCMVPLKEGQGYQLKLDADTELVYRMMGAAGAPFAMRPPATVHYTTPAPTGRNMSLLLLDAPEGEYAVMNVNSIIGTGVSLQSRCGFAIWGDDPSTEAIDGAFESSELEIRYWNGATEQTLKVEPVDGELRYQTDGLFVGRVIGAEALPTTLAIGAIYPNPFNAVAEVHYTLPETGTIRLALFDLAGRLVQEIESGERVAGTHIAVVNGSGLTSGLYFLRLETAGSATSAKLMLVK